MVLGKIIVKKSYDDKGDLVFRPLIRAYERNGLDSFIDENGNVVLFGIISDNVFYELFTCKEIPYANYKIVSSTEFDRLLENLSLKEIKLIKSIINNFIISNEKNRNNEESSMEELADDRMIEFNAYNNDLSKINPYKEPLNGYNDFNYKCKMIEKK